MKTSEVRKEDKEWTDIGSGIVARTFVQADRMHTTSKGGPCASDIQTRRIWSLSTCKLLDECEIEAVSDEKLHRKLPAPDDKSRIGAERRHGHV